MIDLVVEETNKYANQSGAAYWAPITSNEIKVLLAITALQGVVQKPTLDQRLCTRNTIFLCFSKGFKKIKGIFTFCK